MGCKKLDTDFFNFLELVHSEKSASEEKKRINYYPFGLKHKGYNNVVNGEHYPYGYNGKEENDELGLEWLDFGARNYDASLGRWMNIDPLTEIVPSINPYQYCYNNPINFVDPTGLFSHAPEELASTFIDENGNILDVRDDGDRNIYLVHDPENWDGTKNNLVSIGHTPEDDTLKDFKDDNFFTEEVITFMYDEAVRLDKDAKIFVDAFEISYVAELKRNQDQVIQLLIEIEAIHRSRKKLLEQMILINEMLLEITKTRNAGKAEEGEVVAQRVLLRSILAMYGNVTVELNDEWSGTIAPQSKQDEISRKTQHKINSIIKKYEQMIEKIKNK
ncbi:RHS repeat-associated core domain-containing protein [Psychroflexus sp. ALD_RP9]|nr:RHS repeat-associated core domain-containing protein [Psychroflexus sp. ALD_RP9]